MVRIIRQLARQARCSSIVLRHCASITFYYSDLGAMFIGRHPVTGTGLFMPPPLIALLTGSGNIRLHHVGKFKRPSRPPMLFIHDGLHLFHRRSFSGFGAGVAPDFRVPRHYFGEQPRSTTCWYGRDLPGIFASAYCEVDQPHRATERTLGYFWMSFIRHEPRRSLMR